MKKLLIPIVFAASTLVTGCSSWVYRIDVQQGNVVEQEALNRVEPGMTKRQVSFVLGTPLMRDPFHADRWDYVYFLKPGNGKQEQKHVAVYFEDDHLKRIEGDMQPLENASEEPADKTTVVEIESRPPEDKSLFDRLMSIGDDDPGDED